MLAELSRMWATIGPHDTILFVLARLVAKLTRGRVRLLKYDIAAQPVPTGPLTPARRGQSIVITEGTPEQALGTSFGRPKAAIEHRLRHTRARYVLAHQDARLVGFQWFILRDCDEDEVRCVFQLSPGGRCAWDFDIFVEPQARVSPVFLRLWDSTNAILRDHDVDLSLSRVNAFNQTSMRAHARLGAEPVGWGVFLLAGRLQMSVFSSRPWLHFSLSPWTGPPAARRLTDRQGPENGHARLGMSPAVPVAFAGASP